MKKFFTAIFLVFSLSSLAQITTNSLWTWVKGDNTIEINGVYGTQGTPAPTNKPGAREYSISWTDASGNLWLFGGFGLASTSSRGRGDLNDLWKYDPLTNQWTWVKGDSTIENAGVYGTQGTAALTNKPGARDASISWTDTSGNLWLFGGYGNSASGFGNLNDLWKYNPLTNQWTWVKGDNTVNNLSVYGTQGAPSSTNKPGARSGSVSWTDALGNLWLFGGTGYAASGAGELNDLWKYNPLSNQWTWVNDSTRNSLGVYGTQGTAALTNKPGARHASISWTDLSGNLWVFGGVGYATSGVFGSLNDLWKYDPTSNQWTWVKGDNTIDNAGVYGTQGIGALTNKPGARAGSISWTDTSGNLWLFGGTGYNASIVGYLNDLWKFDPAINQWTWVKGDNTTNSVGIYGTQGTASSTNKPGTREGAVSWRDLSGNFWLFGGFGFAATSRGYLNDLWKLSTTSNALPVTYTLINAQCRNSNMLLTWQTAQQSNTRKFEIERSSGNSWTVIGSVNASGNSNNISNYTFNDPSPQANALYRIAQIDLDGRKMYSAVLKSSCQQTEGLDVWPNPVYSNVTIQISSVQAAKLQLQLYDSKGRLMMQKQESLLQGSNSISLNVTNLPAGIYTLQAKWGSNAKATKITKH